MTDRELLEKAAKAAGIKLLKWDGDTFVCDRDDAPRTFWNPLTDDGDALRLAVKLRFHVGICPGNRVFCTHTYSDKPTIYESREKNRVQDPYAATRRAIVRAAAAIGGEQ